MILPTKHVSVRNSIIGAGAAILHTLNSPQTVTGLWNNVRTSPEVGFYQRFVLTLDFLFVIDAIELTDGLIMRTNR